MPIVDIMARINKKILESHGEERKQWEERKVFMRQKQRTKVKRHLAEARKELDK